MAQSGSSSSKPGAPAAQEALDAEVPTCQIDGTDVIEQGIL